MEKYKNWDVLIDSSNIQWIYLDGAFLEYTDMTDEEYCLLFKNSLKEGIEDIWRMLQVVNNVEEPSFSL